MSEEEEKNEAYQNSDILYEDDNVIFVQVHSLTAAKYFGPEFLSKKYNYYLKGELYVIYDKKKNIHFVIHKINDSSLSYLDGFEFDVSVSDIEKRYPMLEDKITDIVGVSSIYGALTSILNGKKMTEYELKDLDDTIYKFKYNEKNPGKSIIELKFDREEYFSLFDLDEYDQNFLNMVFDGRSYHGDNVFYSYDTADDDFREGYVMRDFNEENLNKVNEIMSLLRPDINKKQGDDTFFEEASKELYNNFNRQVDYITSEFADMREECAKEGFIEDVTKDLSDPFMSYGIFQKTPMSLYVTTVKILISLMDMARQKNGTIRDALMYVTKSMSVGPYEEYRYEYYCNDPDDSSFQRITERKLDEILEKIYDSDMFVDIEEYREIISKVLSKYPIKQTIKLPSKKDQSRFFQIEKIDPKTNRIILTYGNYTGLQGRKEKRSYSLDEFFTFLTTPELFEQKFVNYKKKL